MSVFHHLTEPIHLRLHDCRVAFCGDCEPDVLLWINDVLDGSPKNHNKTRNEHRGPHSNVTIFDVVPETSFDERYVTIV